MTPNNPAHTFLIEADELLVQIEQTALDVNVEAPDPEALAQLFRAFHTIKGSGSMFGFDAVAAFTHHVESALDKVRGGNLKLSQELLDLVLQARDHIKALLQATQGRGEVSEESGEKIVKALSGLENSIDPKIPSEGPKPCITEKLVSKGSVPQTFRIRFKPDRSVLTYGTNIGLLLNELRAMGESVVTAHTDAIPVLAEIQPEQCYLWWEIILTTDKEENAIKDVFVFVEDGSEIHIELADTSSPVKASEVNIPISTEQTPAILVSEVKSAKTGLSSLPGKVAKKAEAADSTVRVSSERLDRLVMLVGEMVMNQSRLKQVAVSAEVPMLLGTVEELERLVDELRDNVLGIRMMPIGATFSRFKRLVHDLSSELGKQIDLVTEGEETELDKTVLDQLGDPLVHLIRNSLDHGIESVEVRERLGKPKRGTIRLSAKHTGSNVVVSIQDDGKGLDLEAIRAKGIEKKLISADAILTENEIYNLILQPGFSTASKITNVSGRGVGMDVVKRQVDALRGTITITTEPGKGSTISLTLPLTLAIIEGLLVEIGRDQFIVPMANVAENVELHRSDRALSNGRNLIAVRGELVPYIRLRELFNDSEGELDLEKIVIVHHGEQRVGIVVDRVLGSQQTVIQSLGYFYRNIEIVSGATIMGDGRVALIFDLAGLIRYDANQTKE